MIRVENATDIEVHRAVVVVDSVEVEEVVSEVVGVVVVGVVGCALVVVGALPCRTLKSLA